MSLNNINTLQNYEDIRYVSYLAEQFKDTGELNTDYYIHALANLEQRNEYRYSNGIKYGILTYDTDVEYNQDNINITIPTSLKLNNVLSFDIIVNNVETYLKNSQIYNDGNNFKTLMFCKVLGTDDTSSSQNVEIQYTDIDLSSHLLIEAYRAFYLSDTIYVLLHIYATDKNDIINNNPAIQYKLKCYKLNIPSTSILRKLFNHETYNGASLPSDIMFNGEYVDINNCVEPDGLFDSLKRNCQYNIETVDNNYTIDCVYDTVDEQFIKITDMSLLSKSYHNINDLLYFNYYKIDNYITSINNDLTISYPNLLKYYSNRQFNSNVNTLKDIIARSLYMEIYNELLNDYDADELRTCSLIIPKGTQITYVSNVENSLMLHYTNDIYVFFINNSIKNKSLHKEDTSIRFEYPGLDKTILYNIVSKYNTKYSELIDNFIVIKKYTLPFIDDSHIWNINGNQTSIYASGESGGNPNILLIQTYLEDNVVYGRHLNRTDIQQNLLQYTETIKSIKYTNPATDAQEFVQYVFKIPIINQKTLDKLKYATLFAISNVAKVGENEYINVPQLTTIWSINDNNNSNESEFQMIVIDDSDPNNPMPLTIESMFGIDSYIYRKFAEYGHINNIFDDLVAIKLPRYLINGSETNVGNNYFVIERNTALDTLNSNVLPESAYNYNLVEMKLSDKLSNNAFSYATSSEYINKKKLMDMWREQNPNHASGINIIQPYKLASSVIYDELALSGNGATTSLINDAYELIQTGTSNRSETSVISHYVPNGIIYDIEDYTAEGDTTEGISNINEYIPKAYIPIVKESNILHQDSNIINRSNIMSFDNNGNIYYSYIGSSCQETNKNVVHIGTHTDSAYVLSLGTDSLSNSLTVQRDKIIKKPDTLSLDFEYSYIKSKVTNVNNLITNLSVNSFTHYTYPNSGDKLQIVRIDLTHIIDNYLGDNNKVVNSNDIDVDNDAEYVSFTQVALSNDNLINYINEMYKEQLNALNIDKDNIIINASGDLTNINISGLYIKKDNLYLFTRPLAINIVNSNLYIL